MNTPRLILVIPIFALSCSATETGIGLAGAIAGPPQAATCETIMCVSPEDLGPLDIAVGTLSKDDPGTLQVDRFLLGSGDFPIGHRFELSERFRTRNTQWLVYVRRTESGGATVEHEIAIQSDRAVCVDLAIEVDAWVDLATAPDCERQVQALRAASGGDTE